MKRISLSRLTVALVLPVCVATLIGPRSKPASAATRANLPAIILATPELQRAAPDTNNVPYPYYRVRGSRAAGFINPSTIDEAYLASGQEVLIVPLGSGGSGGVFYTLLWTRSGSASWRFVGYIPSENGHLDVHLEAGVLVAITPIYKPGDANCCPSSHAVQHYTLQGVALKELDALTSVSPIASPSIVGTWFCTFGQGGFKSWRFRDDGVAEMWAGETSDYGGPPTYYARYSYQESTLKVGVFTNSYIGGALPEGPMTSTHIVWRADGTLTWQDPPPQLTCRRVRP